MMAKLQIKVKADLIMGENTYDDLIGREWAMRDIRHMCVRSASSSVMIEGIDYWKN